MDQRTLEEEVEEEHMQRTRRKAGTALVLLKTSDSTAPNSEDDADPERSTSTLQGHM